MNFSALPPTTTTTEYGDVDGHTYVDIDSGAVEGGDGRRVPRHVPIELVAVLVPLDRIEAVALQIKVTLQLGGGRAEDVVGYSHLGQTEAVHRQQQVTWKEGDGGLVHVDSNKFLRTSLWGR